MKQKITTASQAVEPIQDGAVIMIGGFLGTGTPENLIDALVAKGVKDLTIIGNDGGLPGRGICKLLEAGMVKKLIASHVGMTKIVAEQKNSGVLELELVPQGSLAEKIRAGGFGLGGILTPTGVGTLVAEGKETLTVKGTEYLLELPLTADFALIRAFKCDEFGNSIYTKTTRNFNPLMASAAEHVIVGTEEILKVGEIDPDDVVTPGIFVDFIVGGEKAWQI